MARSLPVPTCSWSMIRESWWRICVWKWPRSKDPPRPCGSWGGLTEMGIAKHNSPVQHLLRRRQRGQAPRQGHGRCRQPERDALQGWLDHNHEAMVDAADPAQVMIVGSCSVRPGLCPALRTSRQSWPRQTGPSQRAPCPRLVAFPKSGRDAGGVEMTRTSPPFQNMMPCPGAWTGRVAANSSRRCSLGEFRWTRWICRDLPPKLHCTGACLATARKPVTPRIQMLSCCSYGPCRAAGIAAPCAGRTELQLALAREPAAMC